VAVRDVEEGEELTDDYRIFSTHHDTNFFHENRRIEELKPWPNSLLLEWDDRVKESLLNITRSEQPLLSFIPKDTWNELRKLPRKPSAYRSVSESLPLRYKMQTAPELEACA
jgi:hypothetical protein